MSKEDLTKISDMGYKRPEECKRGTCSRLALFGTGYCENHIRGALELANERGDGAWEEIKSLRKKIEDLKADVFTQVLRMESSDILGLDTFYKPLKKLVIGEED